MAMRHWALAAALSLTAMVTLPAAASEGSRAVERDYVTAPLAPASQSAEAAARKSAGCLSCHEETDAPTMHDNPAVKLGCADCHGGDYEVFLPSGIGRDDRRYLETMEQAHVLPTYPEDWHHPHSANPERSYTLLNREAPEYIRFVNPSDYRIAEEACGSCH
ncbi:MAG: hypothetical protein V2J02_00930, partial [Pseudomonadales bacterium]|nr:hypothetical protein [Pseudomonadales bacterium]